MTLATNTQKMFSPAQLFPALGVLFRLKDGNAEPTTSGTAVVSFKSFGTDDALSFSQTSTRTVVRESPFSYATSPTESVSLPVVPMTSADIDSRVDTEMAELQAAADQGDDYAFIRAMKAMDWTRRSADDYMRAVRLALAAGAYFQARHLSAEGTKRFPEHAELKKAAYVLAPPRVIGRGPADPTIALDTAWLKQHRDEYRGKWVVLKRGELVGAAQALDTLVAQIGDLRGLLVTRIY